VCDDLKYNLFKNKKECGISVDFDSEFIKIIDNTVYGIKYKESIMLNFQSGFKRLGNKLNKEICFLNDGECKGKIIRSHSVQNNRILNKLSKDNHVYIKSKEIKTNGSANSGIELEGRNQASVFTGFCEKHDRDIFLPIENCNYEKGNKEQEFLFSYRALAKEYQLGLSLYESWNLISSAIRDENKIFLLRYWNEDTINSGIIQDYIQISFEWIQEKYFYLENWRQRFNSNFKNNRFDSIATQNIIFSKEYGIAVSELLLLPNDLNGKIVYYRPGIERARKGSIRNVAPVFLTIFPQDGKTHILFSFFKKQCNQLSYINNQILSQSEETQKVILSNLIGFHLDNFFISPEWWDNLNEFQRKSFYFLMGPERMLSPNTITNIIKNKELNLFTN